MGNRIGKVVTKTGDGGETGLADGSRTLKSSLRIGTLGDIDELNSAIGVALSGHVPDAIKTVLCEVQNALFDLGASLAMPGASGSFAETHVVRLDDHTARLSSLLPPLAEFILPGGTSLAALLHLARSICRRAERQAVALAQKETVENAVLCYLNRLSDLLFMLARLANRLANREDVYWKR